jgi:hypothetical protein
MASVITCLSLATLPVTSAFAASEKQEVYVLEVNYDEDSGITNANLTVTQEDGSVLGFYLNLSYNSSNETFRIYNDEAYFCGAISNQSELTIPDSIFFYSKCYPVQYIGRSRYIDFEQASDVTTLTFPATISSINTLPATIKTLHTKNYFKISNEYITYLGKVYVPEETLTKYLEDTDWSNYTLINVEGAQPLSITVNVAKAGEFAQLLLEQTDNWNTVNELTVTGELNTNDLNTFKRMKQLTKLDLSKATITDIPEKFDGASSTSGYRDGFNILEELFLPDINSIGKYAFSQCYRLKNISFSKVNVIGYGAFASCGASHIDLPEGITSIDDYAFYKSSLKEITIPSSVTQINDYCFAKCDSLKTVTIPPSVTKIDDNAFAESGLESISFPGVIEIGYYSFSDCGKLTSLKLPESLKKIGAYSFRKCTALTEIDLPSTLCEMESSSFYGCNNIKKVICRAVTPPTNNNGNSILDADYDITDVKLYVPAPSIENYRLEKGWNTFYTVLPLEDKTSNAYIYDYVTIDDATRFTTDCDLTLDLAYQYRNGSFSRQYINGAVVFSGSTTLSMRNYVQNQGLGENGNYGNYYNAHLTSLIANGNMRADNVSTKILTLSTYSWYFISLPYDVKVSDIIYTEGTNFAIRRYSGQNRAQNNGDTWLNLTADSVMHAYQGYILRCSKKDAEFIFPAINNANKNKVFEKESVSVPLGEFISEFEHNRSWNLIGNPYPCYYDTRMMDFTAPITVWNDYYKRYDAYSPIDDSYILHPTEAFFVQRPVDQASITFNKAGRQKDDVVQSLESIVPSSRSAGRYSRKVYDVILSNDNAEDHTRFVINGIASRSYELDKDASKFITDDNKSILVYTIENGVKYSINERPLSDGKVNLGFYAPTDGEYTLSINSSKENNIVIMDNETNVATTLNEDFHFNTSAGFNNSRFSIIINNRTTDIIDIENEDVNIISEDGIVTSDSAYAVYTTDGRLVGNYDAGQKAVLSTGVYVICSQDVKRIIVVK